MRFFPKIFVVILLSLIMWGVVGCSVDRDIALEKDLADLCIRRAALGGSGLIEEVNWVKRRVRTPLVREFYRHPGENKRHIDQLLKKYQIQRCPALKRWGDQRYIVLSIDQGYGEREVQETLKRLNLRLKTLNIAPGVLKDNRIYIQYHWKRAALLQKIIRRGEIKVVFIDDQPLGKISAKLPKEVRIIDKGWIKYLETDDKSGLEKMKRIFGKGHAGYQLISIDGRRFWRGYLIEENLSRSAGALIQQVSIYQDQYGDYGFQARLTKQGDQFFFKQEGLHSQRAVGFLLNDEVLLAPVFREDRELKFFPGGRLSRDEMIMIGSMFHSGPLGITLKVVDRGFYNSFKE